MTLTRIKIYYSNCLFTDPNGYLWFDIQRRQTTPHINA